MKTSLLRKKIKILFVMLFLSLGICSQTSTSNTNKDPKVSGTVRDNNGEPLIGVTVQIKGVLHGTMTDFEGKYELKVSGENDILVFSYVSYGQKEERVGDRKVIDVTMTENTKVLTEVVVTALGIKREKKALGYAVQDIKGDAMTQARDPNVLNNLAGQIAGVQISNVSTGGIGGSPRIIIRGETSLTNNAPLFVVDGVPINNNSSNFNTDGVDFGSGVGDINPDDIESMSILKGATAAALYGSRAANGAVIVTTKSGKKNKGLGITFNSNLAIQPWLLRTPNYQYRYGGGENFEYKYVDGKGGGINDGSGYVWGPKLNQRDPNTASGYVEIPQFSSPIDPETGQRIATPWVAHPDFLEDFFETGVVFTNNVSISNGNDDGDYRLSYTNMDQKGIMPNTDLRRNTVSLNAGYKLSKFLRVNASVYYVQNKSDNMPQINYWDKPIMYTFTWWGMNEDIKALRNYWKPGRQGLEQANFNNNWMDNPYFVLHENTQSQLKNHIYGNMSFNLDIIDGLSLMGRMGTDWYDDNVQIKRAYSSRNYPRGMYSVNNQIFEERNSDFLLTWDKHIESDFQYKLSVGGNRMHRSIRSTTSRASELEIPEVYNLGNARSAPVVTEYNGSKAINSLYSMGQLTYKNMLYLDVTARNDWSSTLPADNNSYFYPSVSLSGIVSEMIEMPQFISFAKIRGSWAQVGNDTEPYQLLPVYEFANKWGGTSAVREPDILPNNRLKPEKLNSSEVGMDIRFFQGRLGFDVAYFNTIARNQILNMPIAPTSGYGRRTINAGKIESSGFEVVLNGKPIATNEFEWDIILNWSTNRAYVRELDEGIENYGMGGYAQARVGGRMGDLYGWGFKHHENGQFILGDDGLPIWEDEVKHYGNYNPDWMAGFKNSFRFGRFNLSALLDYRKGERIYSGTYAKGMEAGTLAETARGNIREEGFIPHGMMEVYEKDKDGNKIKFLGYAPNTKNVAIRDWIGRFNSRDSFETNSFDASYIKLREVTLSYTFPQIKINSNYSLRNVMLGVAGRNLWMSAKAKHIDPESGGLGYEDAQIPTPKSIAFNLSVSF